MTAPCRHDDGDCAGPGSLMERRITGFRPDEEGQWVAELACGHTVHVRHDPPWQVRPWVLKRAERDARVGTLLDCVRCDREGRGGD